MTEKNDLDSTEEKSFMTNLTEGLLKYQKTGTKRVINFFGIELTAPSSLKNPGIVYLSFIVINLVVFLLVFKNFIKGLDY